MVNSMGGNALSFETKRLSKDEYFKLQHLVLDNLQHNTVGCQFKPVDAYYSKETFGDLDIVWTSDRTSISNIIDIVRNVFDPKDIVRNGSVISFDVNDFESSKRFVPCQYDSKFFVS